MTNNSAGDITIVGLRSLLAAAVAITLISSIDSAEICSSSFNAPFDITCPPGYSVNKIRTNYDRNSRDRYYCILCRYNIRGIQDCYKTSYAVNSSDGSMSFKCDQNYYMAGVKSLYHEEKNDRSFAIKCCRNVGQCTMSCRSTGTMNSAGSPMNYRVRRNEFIVGASSTYDGSTMDREWKFTKCKWYWC